jgi:hypothetical protein
VVEEYSWNTHCETLAARMENVRSKK